MKIDSTLLYCISNCNETEADKSFDEFKNVLTFLNKNEIEPSSHALRNIMSFSHSYHVENTQSSGKVEMILN